MDKVPICLKLVQQKQLKHQPVYESRYIALNIFGLNLFSSEVLLKGHREQDLQRETALVLDFFVIRDEIFNVAIGRDRCGALVVGKTSSKKPSCQFPH